VARRLAFEASAVSAASAEAMWPLVADVTRWTDWSWMRATRLREGDPPPDGVGTLRRFAVGRGGSQEEVVAFEPPRHLGYVAVRGLPVRHYRADVHLDDAPQGDGTTGTRVTWRCEVEPLVPGTGRLLRAVLRRMVASFARRVCRYADLHIPGGQPD
jgi:hypothetical protein